MPVENVAHFMEIILIVTMALSGRLPLGTSNRVMKKWKGDFNSWFKIAIIWDGGCSCHHGSEEDLFGQIVHHRLRMSRLQAQDDGGTLQDRGVGENTR